MANVSREIPSALFCLALSTSNETSSLQSIRAEQFSKRCGIHQVIIQRSKIISDALNFYKSYDFTSSKLYVKFDGEEGEDLDGVTREFFSSFWYTFRKQRMEGASHYTFKVNFAKILSANELNCLGRILSRFYFDRLFAIVFR